MFECKKMIFICQLATFTLNVPVNKDAGISNLRCAAERNSSSLSARISLVEMTSSYDPGPLIFSDLHLAAALSDCKIAVYRQEFALPRVVD